VRSLPVVEALLGLNSQIHLMAIHCAAAKHGGVIRKIERKFMGTT